VGYDAANDCAGADAWTCLARTVEEVTYRRAGGDGGGLRGDRRNGREDVGGGGGDGGVGGDHFEEQDEDSDEPVEAEEALELTVMRCVCVRSTCVEYICMWHRPNPRVVPPHVTVPRQPENDLTRASIEYASAPFRSLSCFLLSQMI